MRPDASAAATVPAPERSRGLVRSRPWLAAALGANAFALAILWRAPTIWLEDILPLLRPHVTAWYVGTGAAIGAALVAWALRSPVRRPAAAAALAALFGAYVAILFAYYAAGDAPAKKFHLLEYGLLAGVTLQAVRVERDDRRGLVAALVLLAVVGTVDENLQRFIHMRTFKLADMISNYVGAALGAAAWLAASPHSPLRRA